MASEQQLHRWAQRMRAEGLSRRTVTEWPAIVRRAARHAAADPCALTTEQLVDYLADLPSAGTRQTYFTALRAWHHWLTAEGVRADDPMGRLRRPRAPKGEPHPVATAHIERLLTSGIRRRTRTASLLAALQGLRVHEVAKVRGEDVDLVGMRFRTVGKGGTERWKPLHPIIAAEARDYPARGWWFPSYVRLGQPVRSDSLSAVISRAMKRAGIPGTAHSLRHWFGTELLATGANTRTVQSLLRHASLTSTQIYTLVNCDQERAALDALALPAPRTAPVPGGRTLEGAAR